jgi:FtsH-binding integral membrane protein
MPNKKRRAKVVMAQPQQQRPPGVTIIGILVGIQSLVLLLVGIITIQAADGRAGVIPILAVTGFVSLVFGLLSFFFCRGLLALKRWAFWGTIVLQALSLLGSFVEISQANNSFSATLSGFILPIVILVYLLANRNVRSAFQA